MASSTPRLYIALYMDEDVNKQLAKQVRANGYDAISVHEVGNNELSDSAQLEYAILHERAILTHNAQDFEPLFREYAKRKRNHFGIIVSDQIYIGDLLRRVLNMLNQVDVDEMKNTYRHLGEFK